MKNGDKWAIVVVSIGLFTIRTIGIENVSLTAIAIIMIVCMLGAFIIAKNYKGTKKEKTYLYLITIMTTLLLSSVMVFAEMDTHYPIFTNKYKFLFLSIITILFIALLIVAVANAVNKSNYKSRK